MGMSPQYRAPQRYGHTLVTAFSAYQITQSRERAAVQYYQHDKSCKNNDIWSYATKSFQCQHLWTADYQSPQPLAAQELATCCSRFLPFPPYTFGLHFLFTTQATFSALRQVTSHLLGLQQRPNPPQSVARYTPLSESTAQVTYTPLHRD